MLGIVVLCVDGYLMLLLLLIVMIGFVLLLFVLFMCVLLVCVLWCEWGDVLCIVWVVYVIGVVLFVGLLIVVVGNLKFGLIVVGGFVGVLVGFVLIVWFVLFVVVCVVCNVCVVVGVGWCYVLVLLY